MTMDIAAESALKKEFLHSCALAHFDKIALNRFGNEFCKGYEEKYQGFQVFLAKYPTYSRDSFAKVFSRRAWDISGCVFTTYNQGDLAKACLHCGEAFAWLFFVIDEMLPGLRHPQYPYRYPTQGEDTWIDFSRDRSQFGSLQEGAKYIGQVFHPLPFFSGMDHMRASMLKVAWNSMRARGRDLGSEEYNFCKSFIGAFYRAFGNIEPPPSEPDLRADLKDALKDLAGSFAATYGRHPPATVASWVAQFQEGFEQNYRIIRSEFRRTVEMPVLGEWIINNANQILDYARQDAPNQTKVMLQAGRFMAWAFAVTERWYLGNHWRKITREERGPYDQIHDQLKGVGALGMKWVREIFNEAEHIQGHLRAILRKGGGNAVSGAEFVRALLS
ncbi:MAG: hypothetical protein Q7S65_04195 [Nanoarchaeota archaeon]|nr:hypothetical protein [Nanoarchaeota archaeon]